ncbi:MAG TPA: ABC transporter ATP-binding protein [Acidimicrobiales bacterium]|nr:ABC transporter ATP-binding protein [Acidimicrobiales bacterium]
MRERPGGGGRHRAARIDPEVLANARINQATLRRAWRFTRPYRLLLAGYLTTIVAVSLVAVLPPLVIKRLIDTAIPGRDLGMINLLVAAAVGLALAETGLRLVNRWLSARIGQGLILDMRLALFDHVQRMPIGFFTRAQTGAIVSRLTSDVVGAEGTVTTVGTVTSNVLLVAATIVAMVTLSWQVTLFALCILPVVVAVDRVLSTRLVALSRGRMQLNSDMGAIMAERFNVSGALLVKLFGRREVELAAFAERAGAVRDNAVHQALMSRVYFAILAVTGAVGTAGVYWVGSRAVIDGTLGIGGLTALAAYVARLYTPLTDLSNARVDLLTALVSFERCFEVLDAPHAVTEPPGAVALDGPSGRLDVDDVLFRYPEAATVSIPSLEAEGAAGLSDGPSDWILRGVSFTAAPGTMTALVGPTGAGKTTLAGLLVRLYDVTSGAVRVDGHDVRELTLGSLAAATGVVAQDVHLFHDSIAANLRYARPRATDRELEEACRAARIHDLIAGLPDGYETIVGERGYRLSGGEKQRLAIARILLKDPAVVVLDEATAHLDSETEVLIQQALASALEGRTSVVIAHRLSTVRSADQILVMDGGVIVQRGTHDQLVDAPGLYGVLHRTQFGTGPDAPESEPAAS